MRVEPYRVFVSYSRKDKECADMLSNRLVELGAIPVRDQQVQAGDHFPPRIRELISTSHVFIPILTRRSANSEWVLQEIGFALGQNIPVLPIAVGQTPRGLASDIQALQLERITKRSLEKNVSRANLDEIVRASCNEGLAVFQCAREPEERTPLLVKYFKKVVRGKIRHFAPFGSFSLPTRDMPSSIWKQIGRSVGNLPGGKQNFYEERERLQAILNKHKCDLVICPTTDIMRRIAPNPLGSPQRS